MIRNKNICCLISCRNLGDALIQSSVIKKLIDENLFDHLIVWTRPELSFLFEDINKCTIYCSDFPVNIRWFFKIKKIVQFFITLKRIREWKISFTIDLIGDFRERFIVSLLSPPKKIYIGWDSNSIFFKTIKNPFGTGNPFFVVPYNIKNIYLSYNIFVNKLLGKEINLFPVFKQKRNIINVGLHPFASEECRIWPFDNWRMLASELNKRNCKLIIYGSPDDRKKIELNFSNFNFPISYFTANLEDFRRSVSNLDLLIGLDSFSVHLAESVQVPTIMISGANHPDLWAPPSSKVISSSGGCKQYPCMNRPSCQYSSKKYICIKSISVNSVLEKFDNFNVLAD